MTWFTATLTVLYHLTHPIITIFRWLLLPLTPFYHLFSYIFSTLFLLPVQYLAKFESLYIYFSIAALIGLLSGTILHLISRILHSLIDLQATPTPPSPLKVKGTPQSITTSEQDSNEKRRSKLRTLPPRKQDVSKAYNEYWETSRSVSDKRSGKVNLLAQTILEEDDSDDVF